MDLSVNRSLENKGDADSGVENASESDHSSEDESKPAASPRPPEPPAGSDSEDLITRDYDPDSHQPGKGTESILADDLNKNHISMESTDENSNLIDSSLENLISTGLSNGLYVTGDRAEGVVPFYHSLLDGQYETVDFSIGSNSRKPDWLDEEKFKRGQRFARNNLFGINFAEMLSLFILFAQKSTLSTLIFTGKSDSPFRSFSRYLNTTTKLISWYRDDVWSESDSLGKTNLNLVRGMHRSVYNGVTNSSRKVLLEKMTLGDPEKTAMWCPLRDDLVCDFRESLRHRTDVMSEPKPGGKRKVWVSQTDMSITQFGFVGLVVTYPLSFGIHLATEDDLDAFLHMWRGLGYLLGIRDEYNYCNGDLAAVRERTRFFIEAVAKPTFARVSFDWEHMSRCLTAGIAYYVPHVNFEVCLMYLCHVLEINALRLRKQMHFVSYLGFQAYRLVFYLMKFSSVLTWLNERMYRLIEKAQTASPETLNKWETKEYSYMNQPGKCPIRG